MEFHPLKIELKDFGSFPSHTIFLNVRSKDGINELIRKIKEQTQQLLKMNLKNRPNFMSQPHLTIIRKLKPWQYEQGWIEWSHHHFSENFIASEMMLLRKKSGEKKFIPIETFQFRDLSVEAKQGRLF
jgi:2'-5' RNA ligase